MEAFLSDTCCCRRERNDAANTELEKSAACFVWLDDVSIRLRCRPDTHPGKVGVDVPANVVRASRVCHRPAHHRGAVASEASAWRLHSNISRQNKDGRVGVVGNQRVGHVAPKSTSLTIGGCEIEPKVNGERIERNYWNTSNPASMSILLPQRPETNRAFLSG